MMRMRRAERESQFGNDRRNTPQFLSYLRSQTVDNPFQTWKIQVNT